VVSESRTSRVASAPGKLLLAGEYAVLGGATAVVIAVDRRAVARRAPRQTSPFLDALAAQLIARFGAEHAGARACATDIAVDTSDFSRGGHKLGLGSSAAATVAAAALAIADLAPQSRDPGDEDRDEDLDDHSLTAWRDDVFALAAAAHGDAQGARGSRGSGADIAAATYGGTLAYCVSDGAVKWRRLRTPRAVQLLPFFTGHSADTVTMVAKVQAAGDITRKSLDAIARASEDLARAFERDDASAILRAVREGGSGLAALGEAAGHDLETSSVRAARAALAPFGGAVKTTGAGGGDLALAVIPSGQSPDEAVAALIQAGCQMVPLAIDPRGARIHP
jgi:phosphomevalonate kinase